MRLYVCLLIAASVFGSAPEWEQRFLAATDLLNGGNYTGALVKMESALAEAELHGDGDALPLTLSYCAVIDVALGRYREGETRYRRAVSIFEAHQAGQTTGFARALAGLGDLYSQQRQWSRAGALYARSHEMLAKTVGEDDPLVGRLLILEGALARQLNENGKAEQLYLRAATILRRNVKQPSLEVADVEQDLAMLYFATGRAELAEELLLSSIVTYRTLAPQHPGLAVKLTNYAELNAARRNYAAAESAYGEALRISEAALGSDSPQMGLILQSYARFLVKAKRHREAKAAVQRSREITSNSLRQTHAQEAIDIQELAKSGHR